MFKFLKKNHTFDFNIVFIIFLAALVRIIASPFGTLHLDQGTFIAWSINLADNGLRNFYSGWSDYFPGYLYILFLLGKIRDYVPNTLLYKIPAILSDLGIGILIFNIVKRIKVGSKKEAEKWGMIASSLFLFNPAVLANSSLWGQVDSITALFSLLSIYLLPSNYFLSAVFLAVGTAVKPQAAFIFPIIVFLFIKNKFNFKKVFIYLGTGLSFFLLMFLPFWNGNSFLGFLIGRISISLNQYPYTSVNAFNFWGLSGFWRQDNFIYQIFGYLIAFVPLIFLMKKSFKKDNSEYLLTSYVFLSTFLLSTRMHERHLLPVFAFLPIAFVIDSSLIFTLGILSFTYVANLFYSYRWINFNFQEVFPPFLVKAFSLFSIGSLGFLISRFFSERKFIFPKFKSNSNKNISLPKVNLSKKALNYLLAGVLVFSFVSRVYQLGSPTSEYFDEVYHTFTARLVLHGDPKAWEWWNPNPEGFAYEWTHPPVAKLGMVLGMLVFGENPFGWRIVQAILGTGAIYLIYLLARELFRDDLVGILSAAVFSLDGLPLVLSRMGMNDSYMLFFMLASVYFFLKKKDFLSALSFGISIASKWSAIWAVPILFTLWLKRKNKFEVPLFIYFLTIPIVVYLASYTPMFLTGHNLSTWWGVQQQMWWYHTGLRATHPYSSPWWSWPILMRPIYLYTSEEIGGMVSRIYAMGNPIVFWFGFASVMASALYSYSEKNKNLGLVVFSYLVFFVPWAASPRIMFLYHYLPSIPFLAIATGYVLRRNMKAIYWVLGISLISFIYFFPHWTGLRIPLWLDTSYYWITSWR